jgi:hypothetical protein
MAAKFPEDLKELLRLCVHRSLLPGAEMPADTDGLFGRVDPAVMDAELTALGKATRRFVPKMNAPFDRGPPQEIGSLQLLAPLWHRAAQTLLVVAKGIDNRTINSIEASIRRSTFVLSHAVGHEARFPAVSFRTARRKLLLMAIVPSLAVPFVALTFDFLRTPCCDPAPTVTERLSEVWFVGPLFTGIFSAGHVLPGLWAVFRTGRSAQR